MLALLVAAIRLGHCSIPHTTKVKESLVIRAKAAPLSVTWNGDSFDLLFESEQGTRCSGDNVLPYSDRLHVSSGRMST